MRIIDHNRPTVRKSKSKKFKPIIILVFITVIIAGWLVYKKNMPSQSESQSEIQLSGEIPKYIENEYKSFSPAEFQELYENITYPNTDILTEPPFITGNSVADARIRDIAESRGYLLRSAPVASIFKADDPRLTDGKDDLLQEKALLAWQELEQSANADGIPLKLNSGYRSIEFQRELFLGRLNATGATVSSISAGNADSAIVSVLRQAALPGYSRHHTGYTVDFVCGNGVQSFEVTTCFEWLKADNYLNAKKHGWIPSYPDGVDDQGPEPEPWEYVWVSKQALWKEAENG